jgi:hypothetical protein
MARAATPPGPTLATFLLLLLAVSLLAPGATATGFPAVTDALGRNVPPGMAGPVEADGLLGPHPPSSNNDITFETLDVTSDYNLETYKNDYAFNTRNADQFENQTTNWDTALGHHIRFTVEVQDGRTTLDCDDAFIAVASIETTNGPLYGWTNGTFHQPGGIDDICLSGIPGVRIYEMVFDLDGAPPNVIAASQPALLPGFYTARLELYHYEPGPTNPTGQGEPAGTHEIGFALRDPRLSLDPPLVRFPETMLRMISDTGGHATHTHQFAMPMTTLTGNDVWRLTAEFPGVAAGTPFTRIDHHATRTLPGLDLPVHPGTYLGDTPLDPLASKILDQAERGLLGVEVHRTTYTTNSVGETRAHEIELRPGDFPTRDGFSHEYTPLHIVTILLPADTTTYTTGAESIVVPVTHHQHPVVGFSLEEGLPMMGVTRLVLQDEEQASGAPLGHNAGDLFALRPVGNGHEVLTKTLLGREGDGTEVTGDLRQMEFGDDVRIHRMLSMLYGPLDEFLGMRVLERALEITADPLQSVEGTTGRLNLNIHHPPMAVDGQAVDAEIELTIRIQANNLGDGGRYDTNITLRPGQTQTIDLPVSGSLPGSYNARITATNGELTARTEVPVQILTHAEARAAERKWYEIPDLSGILVAAAALAAVAMMRRRND